MPTTGRELRSARRAADITATEVAARMGCSRQTLYVIEKDGAPDPTWVTKFREALAAAVDAKETSRAEVA